MRIVRSAEAAEAPESLLTGAEDSESSDVLLLRYEECRRNRELAQFALERAEDALIKHLQRTGRKTVTHDNGFTNFRATFTSRQTTTINESGLKKEIGAKAWNAITTPALDRVKLEAAVAKGDLAAEVVGKYIALHEGKTSIRYTRTASKAGEDSA